MTMHKQFEWWNDPIGVPYTSPSYQDWPNHFWDPNVWKNGGDWGMPNRGYKPKPTNIGVDDKTTSKPCISWFHYKITSQEYEKMIGSDPMFIVVPMGEFTFFRHYDKLADGRLRYLVTKVTGSPSFTEYYIEKYGE